MGAVSRQELLARYMVGRYRLGQESIALYLAGTLFEGLIGGKLKAQGDWDDDRLERASLQEKIDSLNEQTRRQDALFTRKTVFTNYVELDDSGPQVKAFSARDRERPGQVRKRLHNFRWLRNKIMHGQLEQLIDDGDGKKEDFINYLWCELAPESFEKALGNRGKGNSIVAGLYEHTADYMVRAIDEVEFLQKDNAAGGDSEAIRIAAQDFDNLFDLRRKLVPLKNFLTIWLVENAPFLQTDILTTIDTTSAYVWMPLVAKRGYESGQRAGVYDCSVSLLATPHDVRIYLDFGGYNREQRKLYFDFLAGSPEYDDIAEQFKCKPCFEVFDVDWYSFIFNRRPFSSWLAHRRATVAEARKKLETTRKPESSPITWNRCLHGYVFSKFDLAEKSAINFAMIEHPLRDMIEFYQAFERYKKRVEEDARRGKAD